MIEQGDFIVNTEFFDRMIDRANGVLDCDELNELAKEAIDSVKAQQVAILKQIEDLLPILALLEAPTSLTAIIKWVKNFIKSFLAPYLGPYQTYLAQLTLMAAKMAELIAAFEAAAGRLTVCKVSVDLTIPTIELPPFNIPDLSDPPPVTDPTTDPAPTTTTTTDPAAPTTP